MQYTISNLITTWVSIYPEMSDLAERFEETLEWALENEDFEDLDTYTPQDFMNDIAGVGADTTECPNELGRLMRDEYGWLPPDNWDLDEPMEVE